MVKLGDRLVQRPTVSGGYEQLGRGADERERDHVASGDQPGDEQRPRDRARSLLRPTDSVPSFVALAPG